MRRLREVLRGMSFGLSLVLALFVVPLGAVAALYGRVSHHLWLTAAGVVPAAAASARLKSLFPQGSSEGEPSSRKRRSFVVHPVRVRAITPAALAEMSSALVDGEFWADLTSARLDRDDVLLEIGSERGSQNLLKIGCASAPQTNPAGPRDRIVLLSYSEANGSVELRCVDGSCLVPVTRLWVECVTA